MTSFIQWWSGKSHKVRPVTWVCGIERVLVNEVIDTTLERIGVQDFAVHRVSLMDVTESDLWALVMGAPLDDMPQVFYIKHAELLRGHDQILSWAQTRGRKSSTYLIFESGEEKAPKVYSQGHKPEVVAGLSNLGTQGHIIECRAITTATLDKYVQWLKSKVALRDGVAKFVLERTNLDLRLVRDLCVKLSVLVGDITPAHVSALLEAQPRMSFIEAILTLDKPNALRALARVPESDYLLVLTELTQMLDLASSVYQQQSQHTPLPEIMRSAGAQSWLVPGVQKVAKHYNRKKHLLIQRALVSVETAVRQGNSFGALECLVLSW